MAPVEVGFSNPSFLESGHSIKVGFQSPYGVGHSASGAIQNLAADLEDNPHFSVPALHYRIQPKVVSILFEIQITIAPPQITPSSAVERNAESHAGLHIQGENAVEKTDVYSAIAGKSSSVAESAHAFFNADSRHDHVPGPVYGGASAAANAAAEPKLLIVKRPARVDGDIRVAAKNRLVQ
jgi:hypothetical protein